MRKKIPKKDKLEVHAIRLSERERQNLTLLAAWHKKNRTEMVRYLINSAADALRGANDR